MCRGRVNGGRERKMRWKEGSVGKEQKRVGKGDWDHIGHHAAYASV